MARSDRRDGRGRLSSIDLLPEEAEEDVIWALEQLRDTKLPANVILMEFNERLADKDIKPISKSAWNRYAVRKAIQFRRLDEVQRISSELVGALGTEGADEVTVAVAEMIKLAIFEKLESGLSDTKAMMEAARALSSAVSAQNVSADHRRKLEAQVEKRVQQAAELLAEETGSGAPPKETLQKITRLLTTGSV